jgi:hypothetical protein
MLRRRYTSYAKNKRPLSGRLDSAIEHIHQGLVDAGVLVGDEEQEEDDGPVVGFRRL